MAASDSTKTFTYFSEELRQDENIQRVIYGIHHQKNLFSPNIGFVELFLKKLSENLHLIEDLLIRPAEVHPAHGISFNDLQQFLLNVRVIIRPSLDSDLFGQDVFGEVAQKAFFGTYPSISDPEERETKRKQYSNANIQADIAHALLLTDCVREALTIPLPPPEQIEKFEKEDAASTAAQPSGEAPTLSIPIIGPTGEKPRKEKEEKEKEREKKLKEAKPVDENLIERTKSLAQLHKLYVTEAQRINRAALFGLAQTYKIPVEKLEPLAQELIPFILFELQKLTLDDIGGADVRFRLYRDVMMRAQAKGAFQDSLFDLLEKHHPPGGKRGGRRARLIDQFQDVTPVVIAHQAMTQEQTNEIPAITETLEKIARFNQTAASPEFIKSLEDDIIDWLTAIGVWEKLPESERRTIFIKLQAHAITKTNVEFMSDADFGDIFGPVFALMNKGVESYVAQSVGVPMWKALLQRYVYAKRREILFKTHAPGALYPDSRTPSAKEVEGVAKKVDQYGFDAVVSGLYGNPDALSDKPQMFREDLQETAGRLFDITQYLRTRQKRGGKPQPSSFIAYLYQQIHVEEEQAYLLHLIFDGGLTESFSHSPYLWDIDENGEFVVPSGEGAEGGQWAQTLGGGKAFFNTLNENTDRALGSGAVKLFALLGGPEAAAFIEVWDKVKSIPIIGDLARQREEELGKLIKWALMGMAAISALAAFLAFLFFQGIKWLVSQLLTNLSGLLGNAGTFLSSLIKSSVSGISSLAAKAATGLSTAVSSAASQFATAAGSVTAFSGGAIVAGTLGVVGYSVIATQQRQAAFLTERGGGMGTTDIYERRPQPPDFGCFTVVDSPQELEVIAKEKNFKTRQFTQAQIDAMASSGGRVFISDTYYMLLCGDKENPYKVRVVSVDTGPTGAVGGETLANDLIAMYDIERLGPGGVDYTLIHESGHIINRRNGPLLQEFAQNRDNGQYFPTYPLQGQFPERNLSESFAEAIAVYVVYPYYSFSYNGIGHFDFPSLRPKEYTWVQKNIFGNAF